MKSSKESQFSAAASNSKKRRGRAYVSLKQVKLSVLIVMVGPPGLPLFEGGLLIPNSGLNSGPVRGRSGANDLSNDPR